MKNINIKMKVMPLMLILALTLSITTVGANEYPELTVESAILIDTDTGQILYQRSINEVKPLASTSKLMTYLLTMEAIDRNEIALSDIVTISNHVSKVEGSNYRLKQGNKITVKELIDSLLIISGNDSSVALAEHISGSEQSFVNRMNQRALELKLYNAWFYNPHGLTVNKKYQNQMTALELAELSRYIINKYPQVLEITSQKEIVSSLNKEKRKNTNKLLEIEYIDGFKTGYTTKSGYNLVTTGITEKGNRLIAVTLGGKTSNLRFEDSLKLIDFGRELNYTKIANRGDFLGYGNTSIEGGIVPLELYAKEDIFIYNNGNSNFQIDSTNEVFINNNIAKLKLTNGNYIEVNVDFKKRIKIEINSQNIELNDSIPYIKEGRTYIPLRPIAEVLGFDIEWKQKESTISLATMIGNIDIKANTKIADLNGNAIELEESIKIINGYTMVPARFIIESFGGDIEWDHNNKIIKINHNGGK